HGVRADAGHRTSLCSRDDDAQDGGARLMAERSPLDDGLAVRREVLGAEHVERSLDGATAFSRPMQEFVTEHCWGAVWARPGLERRERSILNLGILTALGRRHELGVHVRGALNNGVTPQEI